MKQNFTNNSILSTYYSNYTNLINNSLITNNKLISNNLSELEISKLYNKIYNLSEFDIFKYIFVYDFIQDSLGCNKFSLTEGITSNKNLYNNILIDLFYINIPFSIVFNLPISVVFKIKQDGYEITDLTKSDIGKLKQLNNNKTYGDLDLINYIYEEIKHYKHIYKKYSGNSYTYYIFKLLTKLFLKEVYLYKFNGKVFSYKELINYYSELINNYPDPQEIK